MKLEENTDYELYKKQQRLLGLFIMVLAIGVAILLLLINRLVVKVGAYEQEKLSQGIVSEIRTPRENQLEPKDLCGLEVIICNDEVVEETPK